MCQAVDEMIEDGRREATVRILSGLVKDGILSMEEAASRAGMSVEELKIDIENTAEKQQGRKRTKERTTGICFGKNDFGCFFDSLFEKVCV